MAIARSLLIGSTPPDRGSRKGLPRAMLVEEVKPIWHPQVSYTPRERDSVERGVQTKELHAGSTCTNLCQIWYSRQLGPCDDGCIILHFTGEAQRLCMHANKEYFHEIDIS
jgi:hypothetical protein